MSFKNHELLIIWLKRLFIFLLIVVAFTKLGEFYSYSIGWNQKNHLKAYGITYFMLQQGIPVDWLLTIGGGVFLAPHSLAIQWMYHKGEFSIWVDLVCQNQYHPSGDFKSGSQHECGAMETAPKGCCVFTKKWIGKWRYWCSDHCALD